MSPSEKQKLKLIELFSGIGAQKRGIDMTELFDCEVVATSDIDKDAMLSYASVHNGLTPESMETMDYPSPEMMVKELSEKNIGYDFKKEQPYDWKKLSKRKGNPIRKYYAAMRLSNNLGDISKISDLPNADMWTYSFPCQDISLAGNQKGIVAEETRSGLLYEVERLLKAAQDKGNLPTYLLLENVKNLVGSKFIDQFNDWIDRLDAFGYNTYWKVINGKNCGVPQNRERTFAISILKTKDTKLFTFPEPFDNGIRLIDVLDEIVDEKYYIDNEKVQRFLGDGNNLSSLCFDACQIKREGKAREYNDYSPTLTSRNYKDPRLINENAVKQVGNIVNTGNWDNPQRGRIYSKEGICPALNTCGGGGLEPKIVEPMIAASRGRNSDNGKTEQQLEINNSGCSNTITSVQKDNYVVEPSIYRKNAIQVAGSLNPEKRCQYRVRVLNPNGISQSLRATDYKDPAKIIDWYMQDQTINKKPGRVVESGQIRLKDRNYNKNGTIREDRFETRKDGISNALLTNAIKNCVMEDRIRIRKLTPTECWRLMGFRDSDIENSIHMGISDSQLYKQAGNSIITNCIALIMEHLFKAQYDQSYICYDENFTNPQGE